METVINKIAHQFEAKTKRHRSKKKSLRLYQRLYNLLKVLIINTDLPEGTVLPATRILAEKLDLSRTTVNRAYELLRLEGYVESHQGSGHVVKSIHDDETPLLDTNLEKKNYPSLSEVGESFLSKVTLINSTDDKSIAFRPGLPPLDIFPVNHWKNLSNHYWRYIKSSALSYSPASGIDQLKKNIANYLNLTRGIKCDYRQIIIVSGSLQSLYLIGSVLLNPSDGISIENPTFPNVNSIFKGLRAQLNPISIDQNGLVVNELKEAHHLQSKLLHCTPSCQYPMGVQMSIERRKELIKWAQKNGKFIIENDYEHEVHNHKNHIPSIFSLDKSEHTIYLSTFNRILHPSIRLGYMVLPPYLLDPIEALLKHSHRFVPPSIQVVLNQFIEKKLLHTHVKKVIDVAHEREELFKAVFNNAFNEKIKITENQTHSLHLLAELPKNVDDREIVQLFSKNNIITHPYSKCFIDDEKKAGFILGYSSVREPVIKQKINQMANLYKKNSF